MFFMRGNLLVARGALAQTETERDAYFEDATYAYRRAEKVKPNNKGSDLPNSRANLCLYKSDNKTGYADAALFLNQANGFISEAIQDAKQHNLTALPYFLYVTMGRYYLADARVHPHTSDTAIANAEGCFAGARDGCRTSPRRTKAINHVIAQLQAIYADLPPVIKTGDPYAPLRQKPDGAENAACG